MRASDYIFDEVLIKDKLLSYDSPERCELSDERFDKTAVVVLILPHKGKPYNLIMIKRTTRKGDRYSGEMAFPGGRYERKDKSLKETALRETEEELGIPRENIKILGCLDDHITPKFSVITPLVAYIDQDQAMTPQPEEVQEIVKIPINFFAQRKRYRERTYMLKNNLIAVGKYKYRAPNNKTYVIFGATSHIIVSYLEAIYALRFMKKGARRLTCSDFRQTKR
ncbi:MAG: NUDIX domain-containing protein [Candidatus Lokiarchaeota archaeon]|nr:NUDIX domain-containing protein [Candidatus Lokiarchaeota archaeon]MBD3340330.1 NUDIX domain-containing protein [Candidatus Lokiarchaeota archaeon]